MEKTSQNEKKSVINLNYIFQIGMNRKVGSYQIVPPLILKDARKRWIDLNFKNLYNF